jgi:uncharacterized protein YjbJ (UPF0337 family)
MRVQQATADNVIVMWRQRGCLHPAGASHADAIFPTEECTMNKDIIQGKWTQLKGQMQARWGDLTDDVFDVSEGNSEYLAGKLQERYGWDRARAEREVDDFARTLH